MEFCFVEDNSPSRKAHAEEMSRNQPVFKKEEISHTA